MSNFFLRSLYHDRKKEMQIPLAKMKLKVEILNSLASIKFSQTFINESKSPIECKYKFPSDAAYTIVGLEVKIRDNIINTKVMKKLQVEQMYDDAVDSGNTAVKLNFDEKLPDVIELSVGQLQPGDTALVTVNMIAELEVIKHGFYSFIFPLNFFPLIGNKKKYSRSANKLLPAEFKASIKIQSSSMITNLDVSHKEFEFEQNEDGCEVNLKIGPSKDVAAKDIVISYSTVNIREPQLVLTRCDKYPGQIAAHISYIPRNSEEHKVDEGRFYLFPPNYKF